MCDQALKLSSQKQTKQLEGFQINYIFQLTPLNWLFSYLCCVSWTGHIAFSFRPTETPFSMMCTWYSTYDAEIKGLFIISPWGSLVFLGFVFDCRCKVSKTGLSWRRGYQAEVVCPCADSVRSMLVIEVNVTFSHLSAAPSIECQNFVT